MVALLNRMKISFKLAFAGVMAVSMIGALILSWIITSSLTSILQVEQTDSGTLGGYTIFEYEYNNQPINAMQQEKQRTDKLVMSINTWVPLILFFLSTILAASLFYRWKMKTPLSLLNNSIININDKNLDFSIQYDVKDEMGELIRAFESMRNELLSSFTAQWRAQEDRKLLNAAFAHDIRTPLTVLKGQVDVLLRNVKMDRANQETVIDTLNLLARHIGFIENHTDHMSTLQRLEEIHIYKKEIEWSNFWPIMQKSLEQLAATGGKNISFKCNIQRSRIHMDDAIITRILDNVITNAVRYAKASIVVSIEISEAMVIKVYDDGPGFSARALEHALEPFYHEDTPASEYRSDGLGLFICKTLVEKHGGSIVLANGLLGGGEVTVSFFSDK